MAAPLISPSILASDFARLGEEIEAVTAAGADMIHVDVMDGHFVPNITIGPSVVKALKPHSDLPFDVHLMIAPADPYLEAFAEAGANIISVHPEAGPHLHRSLQTIESLGATPGIAVNPATPVELIAPVIDMVGMILVMSVNPGFGGQSFLEGSLRKIEALRALIDQAGRGAILEVDGGITEETAPRVLAAGATSLVAGTAIFKGPHGSYKDNIDALRLSGARRA